MVSLNVNGRELELDAPPDMPLLWALRDLAGLTGTKYGCGMALCGACTVHVDGQPTRACMTPVSAVEGRNVTTIEGLSPDGSHPVQKAWLELDACSDAWRPGYHPDCKVYAECETDSSVVYCETAGAGHVLHQDVPDMQEAAVAFLRTL